MGRVFEKLKNRYPQIHEREIRRILDSQISINSDLDELSIFERCIDEIAPLNDSKFHQKTKQDSLEPIRQELDLGINQNLTGGSDSEHGLALVVKTSTTNGNSSTELKEDRLNCGARPKIEVIKNLKQQTHTENISLNTNVSLDHEVSNCSNTFDKKNYVGGQMTGKTDENCSIAVDQPYCPEEDSDSSCQKGDSPVNAKFGSQRGAWYSKSPSQRGPRGSKNRGKMEPTQPRQIHDSNDLQHNFQPCSHQYNDDYQQPVFSRKTQYNFKKPCYEKIPNQRYWQFKSSRSRRQQNYWHESNKYDRGPNQDFCHYEHCHHVCYDLCSSDDSMTKVYSYRNQNFHQKRPFFRGMSRGLNQNRFQILESTRSCSPDIDEPLTEESSIEARIKAIRKFFPNATESCVKVALLNVDDIQDPVGFVINDFSLNGFFVENDTSDIPASRNRVPTLEPPPPPPECRCCYKELTPEIIVTCDVGHQFCSECLNSYVKEATYGQGSVIMKGFL